MKLSTLKLQDDTVIKNLQVNKINGVHITTLFKSLFVKWTNTTVYGKITYKPCAFRYFIQTPLAIWGVFHTPSISVIVGGFEV